MARARVAKRRGRKKEAVTPSPLTFPLEEKTFSTLSGLPIRSFYTPEDTTHLSYPLDLANPGEYPFTRGIHPDMYRTKVWTMRQFSGFGTAKETNKRLHFLLKRGQTGLSIAFDLPTLMGYDSDHPRSFGEVGRCGVAVDSLQDMEEIFEGIRPDRVSTSMTINGPAVILYCLYLAVAEKHGAKLADLRGTIQNDILKEYMAQNTYIFPPQPSLRIFTDHLKFALQKTPRFNTISISGYHIREAGSTAVQELAFTLANAMTYADEAIRAGLEVDKFAPRFSFFFNSHIDFFEEVAKFRAARRMWARLMREKYRAKDPRSWRLRFHAQTAGCSLTKQQPENNIVRTAVEALAAVFGGCQSLHTNAMDETISLPSLVAAHIALRTQQVLAFETGVTRTADPLGGSYFVEHLTEKLEQEADLYFKRIDEIGGVVRGIESGFFQKEIADSAARYQRELEQGKRVLVGVSQFQEARQKLGIPIFKVGANFEREQVEKLKNLKRTRSRREVDRALSSLKKAAATKNNLVPKILDAVKAYATLGEITSSLKEVFGEYQPPSVF